MPFLKKLHKLVKLHMLETRVVSRWVWEILGSPKSTLVSIAILFLAGLKEGDVQPLHPCEYPSFRVLLAVVAVARGAVTVVIAIIAVIAAVIVVAVVATALVTVIKVDWPLYDLESLLVR
ncbi:hypothetical protein PM082_023840 [Marasmius tenuissimus]|nr:hypothetical protein PM082_023840 [Marasmius tenuissimus]